MIRSYIKDMKSSRVNYNSMMAASQAYCNLYDLKLYDYIFMCVLQSCEFCNKFNLEEWTQTGDINCNFS